MNAAENVVKMPDRLERLAERAIRAARAYEAGLSKHSGTRADVINAVIDYGKALLEGRVENASDKKFHAWIKDSGIDEIKPFDSRQERGAAMQIAEISTDGNFPVTTCPRTRPNDIIKWWRKEQQGENIKRGEKVKAARAALQVVEADGRVITQKKMARELGVSPSTISEAKRDLRSARDESLGPIRFTKAQNQHIEARLKIARKVLEVDFNERVRLTMLEHNKDYRLGLEQLQKEAMERLELAEKMLNNYKPIFTIEEYKILLMIAHPDSKPSQATLNTAFLALKAKELQLIGRKL